MPKNYYLILGLNTTASPQQIKKSYRRLAKELHPDRSGRGSGPFHELQEAYNVLSDPNKRRHYDRDFSGQHSQPPAESFRQIRSFPPDRIEPLIPEDLTGPLFPSVQPDLEEWLSRWWSDFDHSTRPRSEQPERLTVEVLLSPEEAQRGGRFSLGISVRASCTGCRGRGNLGGFECRTCAGSGVRTTEYPIQLTYRPRTSDSIQKIDLTPFGISNFLLTIHFRIR